VLLPQTTQKSTGLVQRLLSRLDRRKVRAAGADPRACQPHQPAGHRSGEGSDSILPYLAETRPAPLDD
jgi:hypothetical protein